MLASNVGAPASVTKTEAAVEKKAVVDPEGLSPDELRILNTIRARQMLRREDTLSIDSFSNDPINGWLPLVQRGSLGLQKIAPKPVPKGPTVEQVAMEEVSVKPVAVEPVEPVAMDQLTSSLPQAIAV